MFKYLNIGKLHHAYFFEGPKEDILGALLSFFEKTLKLDTKGNPDFWQGTFETFTIDDARYLKALQEQKPVGERRVFVLTFTFMGGDAQNALLKMFEEPTPNTHFFLIAPSAAILLPTLRSRLFVERDKGRGEKEALSIAKKFLSSSLPERLKIVEPLYDKDAPKGEALSLVTGLEVLLHGHLSKKRWYAKPLEELLLMKRHLFGRSSSVKMITEYLSLTLPTEK